MERTLTRRQFGQLVIAGAAVAVSGTVPGYAQAPPSRLVITGVRLGPIPSDVPSATPELILETLDVESGQTRPFPGPQIVIGSEEQVTGFTSLFDGRVVVAITPISASSKGEEPTRLIILDPSPRTVTISELKKNEQLGSILGTKDGGLLGLVMKKNGTPPVRLVDIDQNTGTFTVIFTVPGNQRISNLAECPDGQLYTTSVDREGTTSLLLLEVQKGQPSVIAKLKVDDTIWNNGLDSLVCSPAHQLVAFGALRYQSPKALYGVDISSGAVTKLRDFDVAKVTMPPA